MKPPAILKYAILLLCVLFGGVASETGYGAGANGRSVDGFAAQITALRPGEVAFIGEAPSSIILPRSRTFENGGVIGPSSVVEKWCGMAQSEGRILLTCGGHRDGSDNSLYEMDLATGDWSILFRATGYPDMDDGGKLVPDGAPPAFHSYDGIVMADGTFWRFSNGTGYDAGKGQTRSGTWRWKNGKWTKFSDPEIDIYSAVHAAAHIGNGMVFLSASYGGVGIYDTTTQQLVDRTELPSRPYQHQVAIWDEARSTVWVNTKNALYAAKIHDNRIIDFERHRMLLYERAGLALRNGIIYAWNGGDRVLAYNPETRDSEDITIGSVPQASSAGVFSKWAYLPQYDVFMGVNWYDRPAMFWRPPDDLPREEAEPEPEPEFDPTPRPEPASMFMPTAASTLKSRGRPEPDHRSDGDWAFDPHEYCGLPPYMDLKLNKRVQPSSSLIIDGGTGERAEIGLVTEWVADYLADPRPEIRDTIIAHGDIDIAATTGNWSPAHAPNADWPAYCLTGDEKYIQHMRDLWKRYQVDYRNRWLKYRIEPLQERTFAWQLRNLAEGAKADPDYFKPALDATRDALLALIADCEAKTYRDQASPFYPVNPANCLLHGIGPRNRTLPNGPNAYTFWQQSFITQVLSHVVMLGFEDWRPIAEWNFDLWRNMVEKSPGHLGASDFVYQKDGVYAATWEDIWELNGYPRDHVAKSGGDGGVAWIRAQQVLAAVALGTQAGLKESCEVYSRLRTQMDEWNLGNMQERWWPAADC